MRVTAEEIRYLEAERVASNITAAAGAALT
jgi:hypothetical protein